MRLLRRGERDFLIVDENAGVGGTWWVNRYPGCGCDVQSHLYSLSFAPRPDWTRHFAGRDEIQAYLEDCVDADGLGPHLRLGTRIVRAEWDAQAALWRVWDQHGTERTARLLIPALGGLSRPNVPDIPGLEHFSGRVIHSQQWPDDLVVEGQRVAVIGTGASAIQFIPEIQPRVARLDVYQRTPPWILPKPDRPIGPLRRRLYRAFPPARLAVRLAIYSLLEMRLPAFNRFPALSAWHRRRARRLLARQVPDPALRQKLTPDYAMGCKRVLMSNDYYPALTGSNTSLIDGAASAIEADAVIDAKGVSRPTDLIIFGTGFEATAPVPAGMILGRQGQDLAEVWQQGPFAYKGTAVPGFPNLLMLLGPNTALGHNSVILMIESQIRYILEALDYIDQQSIDRLEVTREATRTWDHDVQQKLTGTVWNAGGCASWYLHPESGRNTTLWPASTLNFRFQTRSFDPQAFDLSQRETG